MAYLDFKVTKWRRIYVPDDMVGVVQNKLNVGGIEAPYDLLEDTSKHCQMSMSVDEECEEPMSIEENGGALTQEIFTDEGDSVWMNVNV